MSLFSDKLWLVANNLKSFANRGKSIIISNLGLCKHLKMFDKKIVKDLMVGKCKFGKAIYIKQINDIQE